jgi:hypothetical protein
MDGWSAGLARYPVESLLCAWSGNDNSGNISTLMTTPRRLAQQSRGEVPLNAGPHAIIYSTCSN